MDSAAAVATAGGRQLMMQPSFGLLARWSSLSLLLHTAVVVMVTLAVKVPDPVGDGRAAGGVTSTSTGGLSTSCPRPCDCYNSADTIDCSQRGLLVVGTTLSPCMANE